MTDLDKGGRGFQRVRTYLGPSLGWAEELVQPTTEITTGGVYNVQAGDSLILINVAAVVTIKLPDVRLWVQQTANQPATGFDRSITIKDIGGNAQAFNIAITPFSQQTIDNIQTSIVVSINRTSVKLIPLIDLSGWAVALASSTGSGSGGGDVFKAGNNTFTGTNHFQSVVTVPTADPTDSTLNAASTAYVKSQNYITGVSLLPYALIESPAFTGFPTAPTPAPSADDNTIVTVGFVEAAIAAGTGGAPSNAEYVLGLPNPSLPAGRIPTNSATIGWDLSTPNQIKANTIAGGGNVSNSGTPAANQLAQWVTPTTIKGIDIASLGYQPLDGDLTAISALLGTNTIYYRSAPEIWSPVTFSGLTFSGGVLTVVAAGGDVFKVGAPVLGETAQWTDTTHIKGVKVYTTSTTAPVTPTPGNFWYNTNTGILAVWVDDGNSQQWVQVTGAPPAPAPPTRQVKTTGSGTYTTPAAARYIEVEMVGGGGGGGSGSAGTPGGTGGATTFGSSFLTCNGGTGGSVINAGGPGGTASGGDVNLTGGGGGGSGNIGDGASRGTGGQGGSSYFGGGGASNYNDIGSPGGANTGGGGGGGGRTDSALANTGGGGGAGGYLRKLIVSPAATYAYAVGASGAGGLPNGATAAGGAGAAGLIIVTEYY